MAGVQFTREAAKRIANAVRTVEGAKTVLSRPNRAAGVDRDLSIVGIRNDCAYALPAGAVVKLADRNSDGAYLATTPDHVGLTSLAVVAGRVAAGAIGSAWRSGVHPCLVWSSYGDGGSRVDAWPGANYLVHQLWGRGIVLDAGASAGWGSVYLSLVDVAQLCRGEAVGAGPRAFRYYALDNGYRAGHVPRTVKLVGMRLRAVEYNETGYEPGEYGPWPQGAWVLESTDGGTLSKRQAPLPEGLLLVGPNIGVADLGDGVLELTRA